MSGSRRAAGRRPPALYAVAKLAIEPRAAAALEATIEMIRPRRRRRWSWAYAQLSARHKAAMIEAEDLGEFAGRERRRLEASGALALAEIADAAEAGLGVLGADLRRRGSSIISGSLAAGGVVRPSVQITFEEGLGSCARAVARAVAKSRGVENPRGKSLKRPLLALARDIAVLSARLGSETPPCEDWTLLRSIDELASPVEAIAGGIVEQVQAADARPRRTTQS